MKNDAPDFLAHIIDSELYHRALSIPEDHFYGVQSVRTTYGIRWRARFSPTGDRPVLLYIDQGKKEFYCTCNEFQSRVNYPRRMGLQLCDHVARLLTLVPEDAVTAMGIDDEWKSRKTSVALEQDEVVHAAKQHLAAGDTLAALTELFFGIQAALLKDMDVAMVLREVSADTVPSHRLPEAMRFVRLAIGHNFARHTWDLAAEWLRQFATNVDSFAPFDDVAPVAQWLARWSGTPDVHFEQVRSLVLDALKAARDESDGPGWWLLYRSVSRGTAPIPARKAKVMREAIEQMRLAMIHPKRVDDAATLLGTYGVKVPPVDGRYEMLYRASIRRAKEFRVHFLLRLIDAHHVPPFLRLHVNPYYTESAVRAEADPDRTPLMDLILAAVGLKGRTIAGRDLIANWPVILRICDHLPSLGQEITDRVERMWPREELQPPPWQTGKDRRVPRITEENPPAVARWSLAMPDLIAGSPVICYHAGRIYIPAKGGAGYPDVFGLTLCKDAAPVGRRLFTIKNVAKIDARQALESIRQGARLMLPGDDPLRLLTKDLSTCDPRSLAALHETLTHQDMRLAGEVWFPDRAFLRERIAPRLVEVRAWLRRRVFEAMREGRVDDLTGVNFGAMYGQGIRIDVDARTISKLRMRADLSDSLAEFTAACIPQLTEALLTVDTPESPVDLAALAGTPLSSAMPLIAERRKRELDGVVLTEQGGSYDLAPLKRTVYGMALLRDLGFDDRDRLRKKEAAPLIEALAKIAPKPDGLPLFARH